MHHNEIAPRRLYHQGLLPTRFDSVVGAIGWLGAVQSQDYSGALWAVGQRVRGGATERDIEQAFNEGAILRTHVLRPTWHFVRREDIRWILGLTAPRVHAVNAYMYRQLELDNALFRQSRAVFEAALAGGQQLTRAELAAALAGAGIVASGMRLAYIVMHAELDAVVCSGGRRGKQFTYALMDERAPVAAGFQRDEALAELTRRYFQSHGPAQAQDFAWWSGLTMADANGGLEMLRGQLDSAVIDGKTYWYAPDAVPPHGSPSAFLLPNYDEAMGSYKDYSAHAAPEISQKWSERNAAGQTNAVFPHYVVIDGWVVGAWKRTLRRKTVDVEIDPFRPFSAAEQDAVAAAVQRYGEFIGLPVKGD